MTNKQLEEKVRALEKKVGELQDEIAVLRRDSWPKFIPYIVPQPLPLPPPSYPLWPAIPWQPFTPQRQWAPVVPSVTAPNTFPNQPTSTCLGTIYNSITGTD
jgi:hypothetical protein